MRPVRALLVMLSVLVLIEPGSSVSARAGQKANAGKWVAPLTPDGQPDLQGVWMNNSATPLERPKELEGKVLLSDAEVADLQRRADRIFGKDASDAGIGDSVFLAALANVDRYKNANTTDNALAIERREFDNRTSVIVDPPDGKIPYTARGQARQSALLRARVASPSDPEALANEVRCLTYEVPRLRGGNLTYVQILQSPGYVVLLMENIHEARVIPLQGGPHLSPRIRRWAGDSRGHWEGQTLVVDTTNFTPLNNVFGSGENLHLVERFTRTGPGGIGYQVTLDDPTAWTQPWTAAVPLKRTTEQIYEVACHEGNYAMTGILSGARAEEKR